MMLLQRGMTLQLNHQIKNQGIGVYHIDLPPVLPHLSLNYSNVDTFRFYAHIGPLVATSLHLKMTF